LIHTITLLIGVVPLRTELYATIVVLEESILTAVALAETVRGISKLAVTTDGSAVIRLSVSVEIWIRRTNTHTSILTIVSKSEICAAD
jgi:hypothetical protein